MDGWGWVVRAGNACGAGSWAGLECPLLAAAHLTFWEGRGNSQHGLSLFLSQQDGQRPAALVLSQVCFPRHSECECLVPVW